MLNSRTGCNWLQPVFLHVGCGQSSCEQSQSGLSGNLSKGQLVAVLVESKKGKRLDWTRLSNTMCCCCRHHHCIATDAGTSPWHGGVDHWYVEPVHRS